MEKRLWTIRSRLRKLDDLDIVLNENEDAELTYMTAVIKEIISNGTVNECTPEIESIIDENELKGFVEALYNISNLLYYVIIIWLNQF